MEMKQTRNKGLDCLRVLAMTSIIIHHCVVNDFGLQDVLKNNIDMTTSSKLILIVINAAVVDGVNIFFLISGFLGIKLSKRKIIGYIAKVYIIVLGIYLLGIVIGKVPINKSTLLFILDPIDQYWYVATFLFLIALSPFLNTFIANSTKLQFRYYCYCFLIIFCIYGFIYDINLHANSGYSLIFAMALYVLGGLIAKHLRDIDRHELTILIFLLGLVFIINTIAITVVDYVLGGIYTWKMFSYNNPLILLQSVFLLIIFKNVGFKEPTSGLILSFWAKGTLCVYLIHSTCWIGTQLCRIPIDFISKNYGMAYAVLLLPLYAGCIYLIGACVDYFYEKIKETIFS